MYIYIYTALFQGVFPTSSCHGLAPVAPPFCSAHLRHETPPDRRRWPATPQRLRMRGGWALHNVPRNTGPTSVLLIGKVPPLQTIGIETRTSAQATPTQLLNWFYSLKVVPITHPHLAPNHACTPTSLPGFTEPLMEVALHKKPIGSCRFSVHKI